MELGNFSFGHSRGEFNVPREYAGILYGLLNALGAEHGRWFDTFSNDIFEIRPYVWCDCGGEDPECACHLPNFLYKPTGYELRWYKHPLRDSYANKQMSQSEFTVMVAECIRSLE